MFDSVKNYLKKFGRIIFATDFFHHANGWQKVKLGVSMLLSNTIEAGTKVLGPLALAEAVEIIADQGDPQDLIISENFFGSSFTAENLLFLSVGLGFISLLAPELRKLILLRGIEEDFAVTITQQLLTTSQLLSIQISPDQQRLLTDVVANHLNYTNCNAPRLLTLVTDSIQPLLFDLVLGTFFTFQHFEPTVGGVLIAYFAFSIVLNELITCCAQTTARSLQTTRYFQQFMSHWVDSLINAETIVINVRQDLEVKNTLFVYNKYVDMQKGTFIRERLSMIHSFLIAGVQVSAVVYVSGHVKDLQINDLIFLFSYIASLTRGTSQINHSFRQAFENTAHIDSIKEFLANPRSQVPEMGEGEQEDEEQKGNENDAQLKRGYRKLSGTQIQGDKKSSDPWNQYQFFQEPRLKKNNLRLAIEFNNVNFSYNANTPILRSVSFDIPKGSFTAIVGRSNKGKTTLVKLLCKIIEPNNEQSDIKIFGKSLKTFNTPESVKKLRNSIAYTRQHIELFREDSVKYNICYGFTSDEALFEMKNEDTEIYRNTYENTFWSAVRKAQVDKFAARPQPGSLSGGEKQRVGIARALGKHEAKIFIFDEPTSNLDSITERQLLEDIGELTQDKTMIMIAHRLSTIKNADQILVLDDVDGGAGATIIERGTHEELTARNGLYAAMWKEQTKSSEIIRRHVMRA